MDRKEFIERLNCSLLERWRDWSFVPSSDSARASLYCNYLNLTIWIDCTVDVVLVEAIDDTDACILIPSESLTHLEFAIKMLKERAEENLLSLPGLEQLPCQIE